jgi:hypothetical protein
MITVLFCLAVVWLAWKMVVLGIKMAWGISMMILSVLFLPALLIALVYIGLTYVAIPALVIAGIVVLLKLYKTS